MSRRRLLLAVTFTVAILAAANVLAERMAVNSVPRQTIRAIASAPERIDILAIGNSLIAAGFDPATVENTCRQTVPRCNAANGGLGGSGVIEHLALARFALRGHTVRTLVYGFFDQQMFSDFVRSNADIIGTHNVLYYLEPQLTLEYAPFDELNRFYFEVFRRSALLRERSSFWAKVEKTRRGISSLGMPPQETNRFGRKADFSLLEAADPVAFARDCDTALASPSIISAPVLALLRQAREHGAYVVVVEMPMHPLHIRRFYDQPVWARFRDETRREVEREGAAYLNAGEWIPDAALFADHLHLSSEGAKRFSFLLSEQLMKTAAGRAGISPPADRVNVATPHRLSRSARRG